MLCELYHNKTISKKTCSPFAIYSVARPRGHYAKWNKIEKDKYCMLCLTCGTEKIKDYNKTEADSQVQKTNWGLPVGEREAGVARQT